MQYLKTYGVTEGPLGFPMLDAQAQALDQVLKELPKEDVFAYRKAEIFKAPAELMAGERADVSWISTEDVDRDSEVVIAKGMDESQFKLNPLVTLQHSYHQPPVGKSIWRKRSKDGPMIGIKAKTHYPTRPDDWPEKNEWIPDYAFSLVKSDLLRGKSIGFLPLKVHTPSPDEVKANPTWDKARLIIDKWMLLEYAVCFLPCQQNAVVEAVSKAKSDLPIEVHTLLDAWLTRNGLPAIQPEPLQETPPIPPVIETFRHLSLEELELAIRRRMEQFDVATFVRNSVQNAIARHQGKI